MKRLIAGIATCLLAVAALFAVSISATAESPIQVTSVPPTPTLDANCNPVDPNPDDVWSYVGAIDPVGTPRHTQVDAFVPEGYVIGTTGKRYWSSVRGVWELDCPEIVVEVVTPEDAVVPSPVPDLPESLPATG